MKIYIYFDKYAIIFINFFFENSYYASQSAKNYLQINQLLKSVIFLHYIIYTSKIIVVKM